MPVITAAVNAKPPLSDNTIGVVVRRLEAASEEKQMQVSQWPDVMMGSEIECPTTHGSLCIVLGVTIHRGGEFNQIPQRFYRLIFLLSPIVRYQRPAGYSICIWSHLLYMITLLHCSYVLYFDIP